MSAVTVWEGGKEGRFPLVLTDAVTSVNDHTVWHDLHCPISNSECGKWRLVEVGLAHV